MSEGIEAVPELVVRLYSVVSELENHFPGRKFTPDGHLVGSIGEVIAAHAYELDLYPASTEGHDAAAPDGRQIQIKGTQAKKVGIRSEPEHLLVIRIEQDGSFFEVYNGPGSTAWEQAGPKQSNGQRTITLHRLRNAMKSISPMQQIERVDKPGRPNQ